MYLVYLMCLLVLLPISFSYFCLYLCLYFCFWSENFSYMRGWIDLLHIDIINITLISFILFCFVFLIFPTYTMNWTELISEDSLMMWIKARRDEVEDTELGIRLHTFSLICMDLNTFAVFNFIIIMILINFSNIL